MKTFRELINLVESAQTPVAEDLIDHNAPEPLAKHFAELYYNGLSPADEAKMAAHVYQQVVDGEMSIEQLKQHIAKLEKEQGVAEGEDDDVEHLANAFADIYYGGAGMGMISATEKIKLARNIVQAVEDGRLSIEELKQDLHDVDQLQKKLGRDGRFDEQGVAEAISQKDLISRLQKDLPRIDDPENKNAEPVKWTGPKKGDYGYTGYQGHGMPTDRAERARIRADKKKAQDK